VSPLAIIAHTDTECLALNPWRQHRLTNLANHVFGHLVAQVVVLQRVQGMNASSGTVGLKPVASCTSELRLLKNGASISGLLR
jgi:hypothetical protein